LEIYFLAIFCFNAYTNLLKKETSRKYKAYIKIVLKTRNK